ncbi:MAG TPA: DegT/DnrJ/EryC1/StrS family aminotransferase [Spirochaetes bacterium]|nr:DegT/DnrJ/EryC1/StrS family aminotransferase [Spirochaetota bacterium]
MNIPFHRPHIAEAEIDAVADVLRSGWITMGEKTLEFEKAFCRYLGCRHGLAVSSATAGLHLALLAAGIGPGDEVLLPAMTFVATAEVVMYLGAVPVMVDSCRDTHLMDPADLERKIGPRARAVIPVHYAGQPCDMDQIRALADKNGLIVIEDAAHSLPAWYRGKPAGLLGDIACFSFYATKTLSTGEGGMVATGNDEWAARMGRMRLHGIGRDAWNRYSDRGAWEYDVDILGYKYNTTDINAALGLEQLKKLEWMWRVRENIAQRYTDAFGGLEGVLPYIVKGDRVSAWHLYPLRLDLDALAIGRDQFIVEMKSRGVGTSVHFIPLYRFSYYRERGYRQEDFPAAEWIFQRIVSLPIYPGMESQTPHVIDSVMDIVKKYRR